MTGNRQPPTDEGPKLNITISLSDIYNVLCPSCQEALVKLLADKAKGVMLEQSLRRQLEAPRHSEPSEESPPTPS